MASENNEFKERKEFNPVLRAVSKWLFGMKRYTINVLLLLSCSSVLFSSKFESIPSAASVSVAILLCFVVLSLRVALEWERVPILRFGRYIKTKGPGFFLSYPS